MLETRLAVLCVIPLGVASVAGPAAANGRFPATVNVQFGPDAIDDILVPATFGLLVSRDGGRHFFHVCEAAVGYTGTYDPDYAVAADGAIYATSFDGLRVSRDGGCSFQPVGAPVSGETFVSDVEIGPDRRVWAATATGGAANDVYVSADGRAFSSAGLADDVWWLSVKTSASDATRLYASGYRFDPAARHALLVRSVDGGQSWQPLPTADLHVGRQKFVYLLAVSPTDPDLLFARVVGADEPIGDALYRSSDGGRSWSKALDFAERLSAFVIRADGRTVIAGSAAACPGEDQAAAKGCVRISDDGGVTWRTPGSQPKMGCIGERADGVLYACGDNFAPDMFALARSGDGESWHEVMRFADIAGPLECPDDTVQARECVANAWPILCATLDICQAAAGPAPHVPRRDDGGGIYCRVGGSATSALPALLLIAGLAIYSRRRSRRLPSRR